MRVVLHTFQTVPLTLQVSGHGGRIEIIEGNKRSIEELKCVSCENLSISHNSHYCFPEINRSIQLEHEFIKTIGPLDADVRIGNGISFHFSITRLLRRPISAHFRTPKDPKEYQHGPLESSSYLW